MDPDREEAEVFVDTEELISGRAVEKEEEVDGEEEEGDDGEEEDAKIFNAWMQRYRGGERQEKIGEGMEEEGEAEGGGTESRSSVESPVQRRTDRRASLPCPVRETSHSTTHLKASCMVAQFVLRGLKNTVHRQ